MMKTLSLTLKFLVFFTVSTIGSNDHSQSPSPAIREEKTNYSAGGVTLKGFVAYDEHIRQEFME